MTSRVRDLLAVEHASSLHRVPDMVIAAVAKTRVRADLHCILNNSAVDHAPPQRPIERKSVHTHALIVPLLTSGVFFLQARQRLATVTSIVPAVVG